MYTQCPECQTLFRITAAQLESRAGLVRCGRCKTVFQAHRSLRETLPVLRPNAPDAVEAPEEKATQKKTPPPQPAPRQDENAEIPALVEPRVERAHTRTVFWVLGNVTLMGLLLMQGAYFYRNELAMRYPALRPALLAFCDYLGCRLETPSDTRLIELLEQTRVEPHPNHRNALRVKIFMVNRANHSQPYPHLEISLSDRGGNLLARRIFTPLEYLGRRPAPDELLPPNVVKHIELDVINPHGKAAGYEIRPVAPRSRDPDARDS